MGEERRVKVSGLSLEHPDYAGKLRGEKSQANLMIGCADDFEGA